MTKNDGFKHSSRHGVRVECLGGVSRAGDEKWQRMMGSSTLVVLGSE